MDLPYVLFDVTSRDAANKWQRQFVTNGRQRHEGIWRRTQEPTTAQNSGYRSPDDARWKLVHFYDEYDLIDDHGKPALAIIKPYLWWNTALPSHEMTIYRDRTLQAMTNGGWHVIEKSDQSILATRHDMTAIMHYMSHHEAESLSQRSVPPSYQILDCEIFGPVMHLTNEERLRPWKILQSGIRKPLQRGNPTVATDSGLLQKFLPFQLELGCGPSIEAGIPPLAHLHKTYAISDPKTHHFLLGGEDDLPMRFFSDIEAFYDDASLLYATAMKAEPSTIFYRSLKRLFESGHILNPVFTNNYDGLVSDIGMSEHYMRRFEDVHNLPEITFHANAKALVVVGSHADRRKLQEKARNAGLQVIYVDPERYFDDQIGRYYDYPLEAPQDNDIIYRMTAEQFAETILTHL